MNKLKSRLLVSITGDNVERIILRLNKNKINIYNIKYISKDRCNIIIDYNKFDKVLELNTIYDIKIISYLGNKKIISSIKRYMHIFILGLLCIIFLFILSNIIFKVEIVTTDNNMKNKLYSSLKYYDIKPYKFKKNYKYIQEVKEKILDMYSNDIEWIEIEEKGTKYIVRYEPRIIKENNSTNSKRNVVAKKNAIIRKIYSSKGQILKQVNNYVKKGDIIISGDIYLNDEIKDIVSADGIVLGEVWYETKVVYPFNYYERIKTGKKKNVYSISIFNTNIELFNIHPFSDKIEDRKVIIKNNILPISFNKNNQEEVIIKTGMNTKEETELHAIKLAYNKIYNSLGKYEYIIDYKILDSKIIDKGVELRIFFSVCENISEYININDNN